MAVSSPSLVPDDRSFGRIAREERDANDAPEAAAMSLSHQGVAAGVTAFPPRGGRWPEGPDEGRTSKKAVGVQSFPDGLPRIPTVVSRVVPLI